MGLDEVLEICLINELFREDQNLKVAGVMDKQTFGEDTEF